MKIIFLDIDGVFNSEDFADYITEQYKGGIKGWMQDGHDNQIDPQAVDKVYNLCKDHGIKLVISSTWRMPSVKETIREFFKYKDLMKLCPYIIGITPYSNSRYRGQEIKYFLNYVRKKDFNISNTCFDKIFWNKYYTGDLQYCIVDDDNDMLDEQLKNFVQTNWIHGITDENIKKIKEIFEIK